MFRLESPQFDATFATCCSVRWRTDVRARGAVNHTREGDDATHGRMGGGAHLVQAAQDSVEHGHLECSHLHSAQTVKRTAVPRGRQTGTTLSLM